MAISRNFLVIGSLYLPVGIFFGIYMSVSENYAFTPLHAHINLLGFVLMTACGLVYRQFPAMAANLFGVIHFWTHQIGVAILLVMLFLLFSGKMTEAGMVPLAPIAEIAILTGFIAFAWNLYRNGR